MAEKNLEAVRKSFSRQAAGFDDPSRNFSRADYLRHLVEVLELGGDEHVLEVAAGTCACGRALAQYAASVTCLDQFTIITLCALARLASTCSVNLRTPLGVCPVG